MNHQTPAVANQSAAPLKDPHTMGGVIERFSALSKDSETILADLQSSVQRLSGFAQPAAVEKEGPKAVPGCQILELQALADSVERNNQKLAWLSETLHKSL